MQSKAVEIQRLVTDEMFGLVNLYEIAKDTTVFGLQLLDHAEQVNSRVRFKSRLVAQNYGDRKADYLLIKTLTVKCFTQSVLIALADSILSFSVYSSKIIQT